MHVTSGLEGGGAEMMLFKLLSQWPGAQDRIEVVSLTDRGVLAEKIENLGIPVITLGMPRGRPSVVGFWRLVARLHQDPPDIVHCWMYHGNLVGGFAALVAGCRDVIWGIRSSLLDAAGCRPMTRWTIRIGAWLSGVLPRRIVSCSAVARDEHVGLGYAARKMMVIPNGFDLGRFKPDPAARESVRAELGIPPDAGLIGFVARYDPQKDHRNFLAAAGRVATPRPGLHFLLCGHGVDSANPELARWINEEGLQGRVHLLGRRDDVPRLTAALDLATCTSSCGEAFPNVLGEAMACGIPCVTTDVGDSADIVGDSGLVVPPRDPARLADGWARMWDGGPGYRRHLGALARERVTLRFELAKVVASYVRLYRELMPDPPSHNPAAALAMPYGIL